MVKYNLNLTNLKQNQSVPLLWLPSQWLKVILHCFTLLCRPVCQDAYIYIYIYAHVFVPKPISIYIRKKNRRHLQNEIFWIFVFTRTWLNMFLYVRFCTGHTSSKISLILIGFLVDYLWNFPSLWFPQESQKGPSPKMIFF